MRDSRCLFEWELQAARGFSKLGLGCFRVSTDWIHCVLLGKEQTASIGWNLIR